MIPAARVQTALNFRSTYGVLKCVYRSVPRAVASATQSAARSLPLAVLIHRAFLYTQSQTDLTGAMDFDVTGACSQRRLRELLSKQISNEMIKVIESNIRE